MMEFSTIFSVHIRSIRCFKSGCDIQFIEYSGLIFDDDVTLASNISPRIVCSLNIFCFKSYTYGIFSLLL